MHFYYAFHTRFVRPGADTFILDTDASNLGIGAVLSQLQDGQEKVISYASKMLSDSQRCYCVTYRELLAIVVFVKQFRHYLLGRKFKIRTDHASLRWLSCFKDAEGMVGRWITYLSTFDYELEHRKGTLTQTHFPERYNINGGWHANREHVGNVFPLRGTGKHPPAMPARH